MFDGHGGVSAGQYLCKQLYKALSDAIDEETYGEECSLEGVSCAHWYISFWAPAWRGAGPHLAPPVSGCAGPAFWERAESRKTLCCSAAGSHAGCCSCM